MDAIVEGYSQPITSPRLQSPQQQTQMRCIKNSIGTAIVRWQNPAGFCCRQFKIWNRYHWDKIGVPRNVTYFPCLHGFLPLSRKTTASKEGWDGVVWVSFHCDRNLHHLHPIQRFPCELVSTK